MKNGIIIKFFVCGPEFVAQQRIGIRIHGEQKAYMIFCKQHNEGIQKSKCAIPTFFLCVANFSWKIFKNGLCFCLKNDPARIEPCKI
jgi:hypothetical protein